MSTIERVLLFSKKFNGNGFNKVASKVKIIAAEKGGCQAEFKVEEEHTNAAGILHTGFATTVVDVVSSYGLRAVTGYKISVSINIRISFFRAAKIGDEIIVDSKPLKIGKTLAYLLVSFRNKQTGELFVKGAHTMCILDKEIPD